MDNWVVNIRTLRPLPDFLRIATISEETRHSPDYFLQGLFRPGETHAFFQYTLCGEGFFRNAAGEHRLPPGTGFLCRAADPATAYGYPPGASEPWRFLWISFGGTAALRLVDELVQRHGALFRLPADGTLLEPFLAYRNSSGLLPDPDRPEEFLALELDAYSSARLATDFLLGLGESRTEPGSEDPRTLLVRRAQKVIRENLNSGINAQSLARALDISREHLTRVFHEQTGLSPYQYILRQRILRACHFLKETALTQKEIAARLGYPSAENFSRAFHRAMQLPPGAFRRHGVPPVE